MSKEETKTEEKQDIMIHEAKTKNLKYSRFPVRSRAHVNPLTNTVYDHPNSPFEVEWNEMYPTMKHNEDVTILDVGCAYGGLLCSIANVLPDKYMLGVEIRAKVSQFTQDRIRNLRNEHPGKFNNIWAIKSNAMKYLPFYFKKGQLEKIFFMFPDPHFKKKNYRRRIITAQLIAEYAYILKKGGMIYTITDVKELGDWMQQHLDEHPLFERVPDEELKNDILIPYISKSSEDGQRTDAQRKEKYLAVYRKIQ